MKAFPLPVVAFGPGSQSEDEELAYIDMPKDMHTFSAPGLQEELDPALRDEALALVRGLIDAMRGANFGSPELPADRPCRCRSARSRRGQ